MDRGHGPKARVGHGLPKVSLGPAMLELSMPSGRATPETALRPFQGWPAGFSVFDTLTSPNLPFPKRLS